MSEEIKDHNFKSGEWFYALDGSVYEFINDDEGSRKVCEVVDLEKTAFMSKQMKDRGNLLAAAPEMYEMLENSLNEIYMLVDRVNEKGVGFTNYDDMYMVREIKFILAKARGES